MSSDQDPVHLIEDAETGDRFLVYATEKGLRLDLRYEGATLWMSQAQIARLFGRDQSVISRHINNIVDEGELEAESNMQKVHNARSDRPVAIYSLDMIISVGYRCSSAQATLFRRWATGVLVQFARKGFVVDSPRLKQAGQFERIAELREIIRDIRSDEANLYAELKRICAMCQDYQSSSAAVRFYQQTQAKLVHAVTSHTPAEVVASRANGDADDMGLQSWPNDNIRKSDVVISKNYLLEPEIRELNRLTTILLDIFEDQLDLGRLVVMRDAEQLLDRQLEQLGRNVLRGGGPSARRRLGARLKASTIGSTSAGDWSEGVRPTSGSATWRGLRKACQGRPDTDAKRYVRTRIFPFASRRLIRPIASAVLLSGSTAST